MEKEKTKIETKICSVCAEEKPLTEFNSDGNGSRRILCSDCRIARRKARGEYDIHNTRRLNRRVSLGVLTPQQYVTIAYHSHCVYCGATRGESGKLTVDHIIPIRVGGTGAFENVVPACKSCNSSKRDTMLVQWFFESETFTDELFRDFIKYAAEKAGRTEKSFATMLYTWYTAENFGSIEEGVKTVDDIIAEKAALLKRE